MEMRLMNLITNVIEDECSEERERKLSKDRRGSI